MTNPVAFGRGLLLVVAVGAAVPAFAVERVVAITAPASVVAGAKLTITVAASTDAAEGEQIGFFHVEYSIDDGRTWTGMCYDQNAGPALTRQSTFATGAAGSRTLVRARIAFRGGPAGDVDFNGAAIKWKNSWEAWEEPPAKYATITVVAP
jgi:hypothetical protein